MDTTTKHRGGDRLEGLNPVEEIQTVPFDHPLSDEQTASCFSPCRSLWAMTLSRWTLTIAKPLRTGALLSPPSPRTPPSQTAPAPSADGGGGGEALSAYRSLSTWSCVARYVTSYFKSRFHPWDAYDG